MSMAKNENFSLPFNNSPRKRKIINKAFSRNWFGCWEAVGAIDMAKGNIHNKEEEAKKLLFGTQQRWLKTSAGVLLEILDNRWHAIKYPSERLPLDFVSCSMQFIYLPRRESFCALLNAKLSLIKSTFLWQFLPFHSNMAKTMMTSITTPPHGSIAAV